MVHSHLWFITRLRLWLPLGSCMGCVLRFAIAIPTHTLGKESELQSCTSKVWIEPKTDSHQNLAGRWKRRLGCHAGGQEASRCRAKGRVTCTLPPSVNKAANSGFETQRRHHQKSKTGYQWPPKMTYHIIRMKGIFLLVNYELKQSSSLLNCFILTTTSGFNSELTFSSLLSQTYFLEIGYLATQMIDR